MVLYLKEIDRPPERGDLVRTMHGLRVVDEQHEVLLGHWSDDGATFRCLTKWDRVVVPYGVSEETGETFLIPEQFDFAQLAGRLEGDPLEIREFTAEPLLDVRGRVVYKVRLWARRRRYRLVREYPASKPLGTVATESVYFGNRVYNAPTGGNQLTASEVEGWPAYWELIEDPQC